MKYIFYSTEVATAQTKLWEHVHKKQGLYVLKVTKANSKRSLSQNAYYWGVVVKIIADHTGYTSHEVHQWLAAEFLGYEKNGKQFTKSTTELDTVEFEKYLERVRRWAETELKVDERRDKGLFIPLPNEVTEDMFDELEQL